MVAAAITDSKIVIENLQPNVPDYDIIDILNRMGVNIAVNENCVEVNGGELSATTIDARDIPDLVPPCAVLACHAKGETRIYNAQRLKIKESNRLQVLYTELRKMGAEILTTTDGLRIKGPNQLHGATLDPHNDHRIAMACAVAGLNSKGETIILNAECVNKSYPTFYDDMKTLGANIIVR